MDKGNWIGIDLGKFSFFAAVAGAQDRPERWRALPAREFKNDAQGVEAFVDWAAAFAALEGLCVESTGRLAFTLMQALDGRIAPMAIINPRLSKNYRQALGMREKTDHVDACVLAFYGAQIRPKPTQLRGDSQRELRELNRHFTRLSTALTATREQLLDTPSKEIRESLARTIGHLEEELQHIQKTMEENIAQDPVMSADAKRILSIKGIGKRTVHVVLAELGDLRAYTRDELIGYTGLFPKRYESGTSVHRRPRMAKGGGGPVRRALYLCAMSARTHNPQMRAFFERLRKEGKPPMVALGAIMRKLLLLARTLLIQEIDYDPKFA